MKRLLSLLLVLLPLALFAQTEEALLKDFKENVHRACLSSAPYEYIPSAQTPAPKGFKPFYISHYGRHGSRSSWNRDGEYEEFSSLFHKADSAGLLTPEGQAAMRQIDTIILLYDHMAGRLTPLGAQEHRQIAGRMYENYRDVFRKGSKKVVARSSVVPRVLVSMAAFTGELLSRQKDLQISWDTGDVIMQMLSSGDPEHVKDSVTAWILKWDKQNKYGTEAFMKRVFTDPEAAEKMIGGRDRRFMRRTFTMAATCPAFGLDDRLFKLFDWEDILHQGQRRNISMYMRQCNSIPFGDDRMPHTDSLLIDIIERADAAVAGGDVAADLRFGHDFHLMATAARLRLAGVGERLNFEESINWPGWRYSPFAGNIQLIFYRNKKGEVLVKPLLNERETAIIGLDGFPYYKWEDVRALWQ